MPNPMGPPTVEKTDVGFRLVLDFSGDEAHAIESAAKRVNAGMLDFGREAVLGRAEVENLLGGTEPESRPRGKSGWWIISKVAARLSRFMAGKPPRYVESYYLAEREKR